MGHQRIQETFRAISPKHHSGSPPPTIFVGSSGSGDSFSNSLSQAAQEIAQLRQVYQTQADLIAANTQALQKGSSVQGGSGGSGGVGGAVESVVQHTLGSGLLGLIPLVGGIASLFGGGSSAPAPLPTYTPPPSIAIDSTIRNVAAGGVAPALTTVAGSSDTTKAGAADSAANLATPEAQTSKLIDQIANDWSKRSGSAPSINEQLMSQATAGAVPSPMNGSSQIAGANGSSGGTIQGTTGALAPQMTVNIHAMDSQSFLDRSSDIANAVREAVLNLHPLTSVLAEL